MHASGRENTHLGTSELQWRDDKHVVVSRQQDLSKGTRVAQVHLRVDQGSSTSLSALQ